MLDLLIYFPLYFFAGFVLKVGDDLLDELSQFQLAWGPLAFAGILFGVLMSNTEWDLVLFSAIIIGVLLSGKVNKKQFLAGFVTIGLVLLILGLPTVTDWLSWLTLLISLLLAAILDEKGNDWADEQVSPRAYRFFSYRMTLKVSAILLAIPWPGFLLAAMGLWIFDLGYEIAGIIMHNISQS